MIRRPEKYYPDFNRLYRYVSFILPVVFFATFWSCTSRPEPLPEWSHHSPGNPNYWYGLGIGSTRDDARLAAINEIASQISITISSNLSGIKTEHNFNLNEFTRQVTEIRVNNSLNNIELMNSHQAGSTYYILARLSKQKYYDEIEQKKNDAILQALNHLDWAQANGFSLQSFRFLDDALNEIEPYQDYPLLVEYPQNSGKLVRLRPMLSEMVRSYSDRVKCTFSKTEITMYYGIPNPQRLFVDCADKTTNERMAGIPISLKFTDNEFTDEVLTNSEGFAGIIIQQVFSKALVQYLQGEVNYTALLTHFPEKFYSPITTPVRVVVSGVNIYFSGMESNLGDPAVNPVIGPEIKRICFDQLMAESSLRSDSNIIAEYTVNTVKRSNQPEIISNRKVYQTYANMTITFNDAGTGKEIFQETMENVKGVSFNSFEDAGLDALKKLKLKLNSEGIIDPDRIHFDR